MAPPSRCCNRPMHGGPHEPIRQAQPAGQRGRHRGGQWHRRGVRDRTRSSRRAGRVQRHRRGRGPAHSRDDHRPGWQGGGHALRRLVHRRGRSAGRRVARLVRRRHPRWSSTTPASARAAPSSARPRSTSGSWALGVNLWGVDARLPRLRPRAARGRPAAIINVASAASFAAAPGMAAVQREQGRRCSRCPRHWPPSSAATGVAVTVLCPTFVKTEHRRATARSPRSRRSARRRLMRVDRHLAATGSPATPSTPTTAASCYVVPQLDAKLVWRIKRLSPGPYTRVAGLPPARPAAPQADELTGRGADMAIDTGRRCSSRSRTGSGRWPTSTGTPRARRRSAHEQAEAQGLHGRPGAGSRTSAPAASRRMAKKAADPTLAEIYRYFHAEEQRHANAELALMRRWGMLDGDEMPEPNINIKLAIEWLDSYADDMLAVGARHHDPDARGGAGRRAGEVPARRGRRSGLPRGVRARSTPTSPGTSPSTSRCWTCSGPRRCASC